MPISESSHQKKRRRPPPPLSVTSVFTQQRLPTNSTELWQWPVTSWYLGDVGEDDIALAKESPFIDHVALAAQHAAKPLPTHYRLRWLEEDARAFLNNHSPNQLVPPQSLALLPYAERKHVNACIRPILGVKRPLDEGHPDKQKAPRTSRRSSKKVCLVSTEDQEKLLETPVPAVQSINVTDANPTYFSPKTSVSLPLQQNVHVSNFNIAQTNSGGPRIPQSVLPVHESAHVAPGIALSIADKVQLGPVPAHPRPEVICSTDAPRRDNGNVINSALPSCSSLRTELTAMPEKTNDANFKEEPVSSCFDDLNKSFCQSSRKVKLQFLSPSESRLMGSLTYSIPVPAPILEGSEPLKGPGSSSEGVHRTNLSEVENEAYVGDLELQFRRADANFAFAFNDRDVADELRYEISRQSKLLLNLGDQTRPLRGALLNALQLECDNQKEFAQLLAEEKSIVDQLKVIQHRKKTVKVVEKEVAREVSVTNRRTSERRRSTPFSRGIEAKGRDLRRPRSRGRRISRPSRKLLEDLDDDEVDDEEQQPVALGSGANPSDMVAPFSEIAPCTSFTPDANISTPMEFAQTEAIRPSHVSTTFAPHAPLQSIVETANVSSACEPSRDAESSTAPSPSDDGTAAGIAQSPCGIFPGESEENSKFARVPSPVSPLQAVAPRSQYECFPDMTVALAGPAAHFLKTELVVRSDSAGDADDSVNH